MQFMLIMDAVKITIPPLPIGDWVGGGYGAGRE